jgi:restriction endonuclease S subunit
MKSRIKDIADIQIGYQSRGQIEPDPKGIYRIIQIRDFNKTRQLNTESLYSFKPDRDPDRYLVNKGDILFLSRGQRNFAWANPHDLKNTVAANYFFILKPKTNGVLSEYIAWYLNQPLSQLVLRSQIRGSHIPIITKSDFEIIQIEIPPLNIQESVIKLEDLLSREKDISVKIIERRKNLIRGICMRKIKQIDT